MPINVGSLHQLPENIRHVFLEHRHAFQNVDYIDNLLAIPTLHAAARSLNEECERSGIVGLHFTRADRASIAQRGLEILPGATRRRAFLEAHGHRFTASQRAHVEAAWKDYFTSTQNHGREGFVWFALTHAPLKDGGAAPLLTHYGGEAIYMPLPKDLREVVKNLGEPLVVECALATNCLSAYHELPWGAVWLSTYHRSVNPKARQYDQDVRSSCPVLPANIVSITRAPGF